jgi:hypothetical protein
MPETFFLPPADVVRRPPRPAAHSTPPIALPQRGAVAALMGLIGAVALFVTTLWFVAQQAGIADEPRDAAAVAAAPRKAEPVSTARTVAAAIAAGAGAAAWR